jgi:hypothetical protein
VISHTGGRDAIEDNLPRYQLWLTSFGAGFAAHSLELSRN